MTKSLKSSLNVSLTLFVLLQILLTPVGAQQEYIARAVSVQGTVEVQRVGETQWRLVKLNDSFRPGDQLRVSERSRADVAMLDQSVLRLNANTTITIQAVKEEGMGVINLLKGAAHFFSRGPSSLEVQTPFAVAGVRGTEFLVDVEVDRALLTVFEGTVSAANQAGSLLLTDGQSAIAETGKTPVLRVVARPRDAVAWALHYPPVLYFRSEEFPTGSGWQGRVRQSLEFYLKGDIQNAFESLAAVPTTVSHSRFLAYRASLLLTVGRVDGAQQDIERVLNLNPNDSNALALQTIIAVVQNDKERALTIARQAVGAAPQSAAALIALSYAQQAHFDLDGARASLQQVVGFESQNALAWARLAELHSSSGELGEALSAAQEAVALEPNLSRTQTVLGFAYLTRVETEQAKEAFEKAIFLDQADSLPRLGLGLAKIREGDLQAGGREIEIAASLDSSNSLIRSYLGKTYYEEKREHLDEREYAMAKGLDPQDPTPWFYSAIQKQTANQPVKALQDLQKAIELNDNRAVYRSRLLLDSDLAARSASLARVYSDLGFQQLALVEGGKSVNIDPSNFSAHRFLADSYSVLPRHEIARVSELLQSQLLQPLNMTPLQPQLAESNLFLISSSGPGTLSFNEFNPLFNRNGITAQTSGMVGNNDTYTGEGVVSGIYKNLAFSVGGFHFTTDGWRKNADQKDDIANAFLQYELSPQTSVQGEYRYRDTTNGDLQLNFFRDDVLRNLRVGAETETYRVGLRHAFSLHSILLASFMHQRRDTLSHDEPPGLTSLDIKEPWLTGFSGELQYLFRSRYINITSGVGHFSVNRDQVLTVEFPPPDDFLNFSDPADLDAEHTNAYLYSYINVLKSVTLTLGASGDFFTTHSTASQSKDQFNPKFGLTWEPIPGTTLRAAAFKVFKRTLITNQTLEPTQVAGFNQFFDDNESTEAWRYGGAIDQKFSQAIFGGVEFSRRDLKVPLAVTDLNTGLTSVRRDDWSENLGRAYLFWTPHEWLAFSTEYQYEHFDRAADFGFGLKEVTTHRVPLGFRFFHPLGLSLGLQATYFNQDGEFQRRAAVCCESGASDFWVVDAAISYRLPQRYGFFTVGARNLFDRKFQFQETDFNNPTLQPDRMFFAKLTLAFP
ncbi:MAG: TonB-dependent receptor [Candidatus Binatia bacterium]